MTAAASEEFRVEHDSMGDVRVPGNAKWAAQTQRAVDNFPISGKVLDRELIRSLAKRLAGDDPDSARIRATLRHAVTGEGTKKGGILAALRRSPLVGADLDRKRARVPGRKVEL